MSAFHSAHISSDRLGEAARNATLDGLHDFERSHFEGCDQCKSLYAGYRLTDRLLAAPWRQTLLPASAAGAETRSGPLGYLSGLGLRPRSFVPAALALCLAAVVALGVLLPQFLPLPRPAADHSPTGVVPTPSVAAPIQASASAPTSPVALQSPAGTARAPGGGAATGTPVAPTAPVVPRSVVGIPGWPVAWAPDGAHLMASAASGWTTQRKIKVLDVSGKVVGSINASSATWVDAGTIATSTDGRGFGGSAAIQLVNLSGHVTATLSGQYGEGRGGSGAVLLGSGSGVVAVASMGGWGPAQSSFVIWDGHSVGSQHSGVPLAFSRDGSELVVLHPSGGPGGSSSGWLEVVSLPGLATVASYTHTTLHLPTQGSGPGYAPDASLSPDGDWLYAAGTLVDLTHGSAVHVGDGGWLPDGTLLTSSGGTVLRWQGIHSKPDNRFAAGGSVTTSRHGEVVEYFGDGRTPLLLTSAGSIRPLNLPGVASIDDAQLAPDGGAVAFIGRSNRGGVTELARLK
jgi:hypothetical protein